jgi:hypothetical protein
MRYSPAEKLMEVTSKRLIFDPLRQQFNYENLFTFLEDVKVMVFMGKYL